MKHVIQNGIYKASEPYDPDLPEYDHYICCHTGNFWIVDCFPCDSTGEIHEGYNVHGVPVHVDNLEELVEL